MTRKQVCRQRLLIDDTAARGIYQYRTRLHSSEFFVPQHRFRRREQWYMQRDDIRAAEQLRQRQSTGLRQFAHVPDRGIMEDDAPAQAMKGFRHGHADDAHTDHPDRQALQSGKVLGHHRLSGFDVISPAQLGISPASPP